VCAEHFRDKCATCKERTPVYLKYGITFAVSGGRNFVCLHPRRDFPNEPCGVRFTTQHELVEHRLAHEASERPGGLVRQEVLDRRLEVSAAVVQQLVKERDELLYSSESTVVIAARIDRECARLGYEEMCKPSAEVVLQRYQWARYRQLKFDSAEELPTEHTRLRRRLQLGVMETLMREDILMANLDQAWVVARIAHLWDQVKDQRRGIPYTKSTIVSTVYNWVRRTYTKPVPPVFPPIDRRATKKQPKTQKKRKVKRKKEKKTKEGEEEEEVRSQSDDGYNDNEDSGDTAVNDDPDNDNNYDEDTEDEELATGMEVNEAEEEGEEKKQKQKQNESATSSRSRGGDVGGREAAMAALSPSAGGKAEMPIMCAGLTGRELVLARRRHVMQTLDLLLASQLDE
jgi:hypothetical protein